MTAPGNVGTIVVGVDFSDTSTLALDRALELAWASPSTDVHALTVLSETGAPFQKESTDSFARAAAREETAARLRDHLEARSRLLGQDRGAPRFRRIVAHVGTGPAAEELAQLASDVEADLLVVGTHGRRGVRRWLLGSVAEEVLRLAPCAVVVVRPRSTSEAAVPKITPPCHACVQARFETSGKSLWCAQHLERHGRRHTYWSSDRFVENMSYSPVPGPHMP